ncbi:hypothetical protein Tco_0890452 [Tanacetum coccineum]|uniref:Uncharacterized protein n=1 Tax=Tanacetum coccineum TaxID=301880 RepID=A0ABQ5C033_9ASTR
MISVPFTESGSRYLHGVIMLTWILYHSRNYVLRCDWELHLGLRLLSDTDLLGLDRSPFGVISYPGTSNAYMSILGRVNKGKEVPEPRTMSSARQMLPTLPSTPTLMPAGFLGVRKFPTSVTDIPVPRDEDEREPMFIQAHDPDYVPLPPIDSPTTESPGYVTESDPEEDPEEYEDDETEDGPVDYPMDGGDDGDDGDDDDGDSSRDDANGMRMWMRRHEEKRRAFSSADFTVITVG